MHDIEITINQILDINNQNFNNGIEVAIGMGNILANPIDIHLLDVPEDLIPNVLYNLNYIDQNNVHLIVQAMCVEVNNNVATFHFEE